MTLEKDHVKILFRFHSDIFDEVMVETMHAIIIDKTKGHYRLDNIPFYAPLIASDDIVFAEFDEHEKMLTYRKTIQFSGNSTIQIAVLEDSININAVRGFLKELGCLSERVDDNYFSMEVPSSIDYKPIKKELDRLEAEDKIAYAEPCLAEGHRY